MKRTQYISKSTIPYHFFKLCTKNTQLFSHLANIMKMKKIFYSDISTNLSVKIFCPLNNIVDISQKA